MVEETTRLLKRQLFCDTTKYRLVDRYRRFGKHCYLYRHGLSSSWTAQTRKDTAKSYSENSANSCLNYTASHFRRLNPQAIVHVSYPPAYTKFITCAAVSTPRSPCLLCTHSATFKKVHLFPITWDDSTLSYWHLKLRFLAFVCIVNVMRDFRYIAYC